MKGAGWFFVVGGAILQFAEASGKADAQLKGLQFQDSGVGMIVAPIEKVLPISLGYTLIVVGAVMIWLIPMVKEG